MKNLPNSEELEQVIEKLDNLLTIGHLKYTGQKQGYFQIKDKPDFSVDTFTQETVNIVNDWFSATVKVFEENIKEQHHLFHFLQTNEIAQF